MALIGAAEDFPSFMQLTGPAHREGALFGKRTRAAGQENPARAPGASPSALTPGTIPVPLCMHSSKGEDPSPLNTLVLLCLVGTAKQE